MAEVFIGCGAQGAAINGLQKMSDRQTVRRAFLLLLLLLLLQAALQK
jgi:hypothetical protein